MCLDVSTPWQASGPLGGSDIYIYIYTTAVVVVVVAEGAWLPQYDVPGTPLLPSQSIMRSLLVRVAVRYNTPEVLALYNKAPAKTIFAQFPSFDGEQEVRCETWFYVKAVPQWLLLQQCDRGGGTFFGSNFLGAIAEQSYYYHFFGLRRCVVRMLRSILLEQYRISIACRLLESQWLAYSYVRNKWAMAS